MKYCLAYDSTPAAEGALQMLKALAQDKDKVVVYYLLRTSDPVSEEQANDLCREVIARLQACCRCKDLEAVVRRADDVQQDLLQYCEANEVKALVMGTRGLGLMKRALVGSAATFALNNFKGTVVCIAHAPPECSCPPAAGEGEEPDEDQPAPEPPIAQSPGRAGGDSLMRQMSDALMRVADLGGRRASTAALRQALESPAGPQHPCGVVLHRLPHPTHVERPGGTHFLLFVDGSEPSMRAVHYIARLMAAGDAATIVSLYKATGPSGALSPSAGLGLVANFPGTEKQAKVAAEGIVGEAMALMKKKCAPEVVRSLTASIVEVNDVKQGIVDYAASKAEKEEALCGHVSRVSIVLGSHNVGAASRLLQVSCTNFVLHNTELPLVIVH